MSDRRAGLWAVVPVKDFRCGKSRLEAVLPQDERAAFARGLFDHVTGVLDAIPQIRGVLVLTDDDTVEAAARAAGHDVQRDAGSPPLNRIVDAGLSALHARGVEAALVCMADLPRLTTDDVQTVIDALADHEVVLVPDRESAGTNILGLRPPNRMASCFGRADSFEQHVRRARATIGRAPKVLRPPSICFDVDGPEDLNAIE